MDDGSSRYNQSERATFVAPDGRNVAYRRRRFLPQGREQTLLIEARVGEGERLDLVADRTLGDASAWWRLADANDAMHPDDLTDEVGRVLRVCVPEMGG